MIRRAKTGQARVWAHGVRPNLRDRLLKGTALTVSLIAVAFAASIERAFANPEGGVIVGGVGSINPVDDVTLNVDQDSSRIVIDWTSFSIDEGETVNFNQPSASSIALNRVTGFDTSYIDGVMTANGVVILVNQSGIVFGRSAMVDVGSLVATTADINNASFMGGGLDFNIASPDQSASIINEGSITVADIGFVGLVAPSVRNSGIISARLGTVGIAGAQTFTMDFYGDGLFSFDTGSVVTEAAADGGAMVENTGMISADGGVIAVTALAAEDIINNVINMDGVVEANSIGMQDGVIVLSGGEGNVEVAGEISTIGDDAGELGGSITILGGDIVIDTGAMISASGDAGGGLVRIGGDFHGQGLPTANSVIVSENATITASAITNGDGGDIVLWADGTTTFQGDLTARGGADGGDGGFAEISGKGEVNVWASVDLGASNGDGGMLLIDPTDETIDAIEAATHATILGSGTDITIVADNDVFVDNAIDSSGGTATGGDLTITSGRSIEVNADITLNNATFTANVNTAPAGYGGTRAAGDATFVNVATIDTNGGDVFIGDGTLSAGDVGDFETGAIVTDGGAINIENTIDDVIIDTGTLNSAGGNVNVTAGGTITVGSGVGEAINALDGTVHLDAGLDIVTGGGIIYMDDGNVILEAGGSVGAIGGSAFAITTTGNHTLSGTSSGGRFDVSSNGGTLNIGNIDAGTGVVDVGNDGNVNVQGTVDGGAAVIFVASGGNTLDIQSGSSVTGGYVTFRANVLDINAAVSGSNFDIAPTAAGVDVSLGGANSLDLTNAELDFINTTGEVKIGATFAGDLDVGSNIDISDNGFDLRLESGGTLSFDQSGGTALTVAQSATVILIADEIAGDRSANSSYDIAFTPYGDNRLDITANNGDVTIETSQLATLNGTATGAIDFLGFAGIDLVIEGLVSANSTVAIDYNNDVIIETGTVSAATGITIDLTRSLTIGDGAGVAIDASAGGDVVITASSVISGGGTIDMSGGGTLTMEGDTGSVGSILNPILVSGTQFLNGTASTTFSVANTGGNTMTVQGIVATSDDVYISNDDQDIYITGNGVIAGANIEVDAGTGEFGTSSTSGMTSGGDITVIADAIALGYALTAAGDINLRPSTVGTTIGLGTGAGTFSLTDAEFDFLDATNALNIGSSAAGDMHIGGVSVAAAAYDLSLSGDDIIFDAGTSLSVGSDLVFLFAQGNIDGTAAGTDVVQLGTTALGFEAGGTVDLTVNTETVAGTASGTINLTSVEFDLEVGTVGSFTGLTSVNGDISISGTLPGGVDVNDVIDASGDVTIDIGTATITVSAAITGGNTVTFNADGIDIGAAVTGADIFLLPDAVGASIGINNTAGTFNLSETELQFLSSAGTVTIGNANSGDIEIGGLGTSDLSAETFDLVLNGGTMTVDDGQTGLTLNQDSLLELNLTGALTGGGTNVDFAWAGGTSNGAFDFDATGAATVSTSAISTLDGTATGAISFVNTGPGQMGINLLVSSGSTIDFTNTGNVIVETGTVDAAGDLTMDVTGDITIGDGAGTAIDANGGGDVTLTASGNIHDGGGLIDMGGGTLTLDASFSVGSASAFIDTSGVTDLIVDAAAGGVYIDNADSPTMTIHGATAVAGGGDAGNISIRTTSALHVDGVVDAGGSVTLDADSNAFSNAGAGTIDAGGDVLINAHLVDIGTTISAANINLEQNSLTRSIGLSSGSGFFNLTNAEFDLLDTTGTVTIGVANGTGPISIGGSGTLALADNDYDVVIRGGDVIFDDGATAMTIATDRDVGLQVGALIGGGTNIDIDFNGGDFTFDGDEIDLITDGLGVVTVTSSGSITWVNTGTLSIDHLEAGGTIDLVNDGDTTIETNTLVAGGDVTLTITGTLTVGDASGVAIDASGGVYDIRLDVSEDVVDGGALIDMSGGGTLTIDAGGAVGASNASIDTSSTSNLFGSAGDGGFFLSNTGGGTMTVQTVSAVAAGTATGDITLTNFNDDLEIAGTVSSDGNIIFNAGSGKFSVLSGGAATASGTLAAIANEVEIGGTLTAADVTLHPRVGSTSIGLSNATGTFNLNNAELDFLDTTGTVTIGAVGGAGGIDIGGSGTLALADNAYDLVIIGGDLSFDDGTTAMTMHDGGVLTLDVGAINGGGTMTDIDFDGTASGTLNFEAGAVDLITDQMGTVSGTSSGAVTIVNTGDLHIDHLESSGTMKVDVTGDTTIETGTIVTGGDLTVTSSGTITLGDGIGLAIDASGGVHDVRLDAGADIVSNEGVIDMTGGGTLTLDAVGHVGGKYGKYSFIQTYGATDVFASAGNGSILLANRGGSALNIKGMTAYGAGTSTGNVIIINNTGNIDITGAVGTDGTAFFIATSASFSNSGAGVINAVHDVAVISNTIDIGATISGADVYLGTWSDSGIGLSSNTGTFNLTNAEFDHIQATGTVTIGAIGKYGKYGPTTIGDAGTLALDDNSFNLVIRSGPVVFGDTATGMTIGGDKSVGLYVDGVYGGGTMTDIQFTGTNSGTLNFGSYSGTVTLLTDNVGSLHGTANGSITFTNTGVLSVDHLETDAGNIDLTNFGDTTFETGTVDADGNLTADITGDLTIGDGVGTAVDANGNGNVTLTASGNIIDGGGDIDMGSGTLTIDAGGSVGTAADAIETDGVQNLYVYAAAGDININNSDSPTLVVHGASAVAGGGLYGDIRITTDWSLSVDGAVSAGGDAHFESETAQFANSGVGTIGAVDDVTIVAATIDIGATISGANVNLMPTAAGDSIGLSSNTGTFNLTNAEFDFLDTTGTVTIVPQGVAAKYGDITVGDAGTLALADNDFDLVIGSGDITFDDSTTAMTMADGRQLTLNVDGIYGGGTMTDVDFAGSSTGTLVFDAEDNVTLLTDGVGTLRGTAGSSITFSGHGDLSIDHLETVLSSSTIDVFNAGDTTIETGTIVAGGDLTITSSGTITVGDGSGTAIDASGGDYDVRLNSTAGSVVDGGGSIDMTGGGDLDLDAQFSVGSSGAAIDIVMSSTSVLSGHNHDGNFHVSNTGGNQLNIGSVIVAGAGSDGNLVAINDDQAIAVIGPVAVDGNASFGAGTGEFSNAGSGTIYAVDDVQVVADSIALGGSITGRNIRLTTDSEGRTVGLNDAAGDFNLTEAELQLLNSTGWVEIGGTETGAIAIGSLGTIDLTGETYDLALEGGNLTFDDDQTAISMAAGAIFAVDAGTISGGGTNFDVMFPDAGGGNPDGSLAFVSSGDVDLRISAGTIAGSATGDIDVFNVGNLEIGTIDLGTLGSTVSGMSAGGSLTVQVASDISVTAATSAGGNILFNAGDGAFSNSGAGTINSTGGGVDIIADTVNIGASITGDYISLEPGTAGATIGLGSAFGTFNLSDAEFAFINAADFIVGNTASGTVTIGDLETIDLIDEGTNLTIQSSDGIIFSDDRVGLAFAENASASFNVDYIMGGGSTADVTFESATGSITFQAHAGDVDLRSEASEMAGTASGSIFIDNTGNLSIGNSEYNLGLEAGGSITVVVHSDLTITEGVTAGGTITFNAGTGTFANTGDGTVSAGDDLFVDADTVEIGAAMTGDNITLRPDTDDRSIGLSDSAGDFNLNQTEIDFLSTTGDLVVGQGGSGSGTITIGSLGSLDLRGGGYDIVLFGGDLSFADQGAAGTLQMASGAEVIMDVASITGGGSTDIAFTSATGSVGFSSDGDVDLVMSGSKVAGSGGDVTVENYGNLEVGTVRGESGLTGGTISVEVHSDLSVTQAVSASGQVMFDANTGDFSNSGLGTIDAGAAITIESTTIALGATITGPDIFVRPNDATGTIGLNDASGTFNLSNAELAHLNTDQLTVGRVNGTGDVGVASSGTTDLSHVATNVAIHGGTLTFADVDPALSLADAATLELNVASIAGGGTFTDIEFANSSGSVAIDVGGNALFSMDGSTLSGSVTGNLEGTNVSDLTIGNAGAFAGMWVGGWTKFDATGGSLTIAENFTAGGDVTLQANGNLFLDGGDLDANSGAHTVALISDTGSVETIGAGTVFMDDGGLWLEAESGVSVDTQGLGTATFTVAGITNTGDWEIDNSVAGNLQVAQVGTFGSGIEVTSAPGAGGGDLIIDNDGHGGSLQISSDITGSGDIGMTADGQVKLDVGSTITGTRGGFIGVRSLGDQVVIDGTIDATGTGDVVLLGNMGVNGAGTILMASNALGMEASTGSISMTTQGSDGETFTLAAVVLNSGDITVTNMVDGNMALGNSVNITNVGQGIDETVTDIMAPDGDIIIQNSAVGAGNGTVSVLAGATVEAGAVVSSGNVTLISDVADVTIGNGATVSGTVSVSVSAFTDIAIGDDVEVLSGGPLNMTAGSLITIGDNSLLTADDDARFEAGTDFVLGSTSTISGEGGVLVSAAGSITTGKDSIIEAGISSVPFPGVPSIPGILAAHLDAGGDISIGEGGVVSGGLGSVHLDSGASITVGNGASITGGTTGSGGIEFSALQSINVGDGVFVNGADGLHMESGTDFDIGDNNSLLSGGPLAMTAGSSITAGTNNVLDADGIAKFSAVTDISFGDGTSVTAGSDLSMTAGGTITIGNDAFFGSGGSVSLDAGSTITVGTGSTLTASSTMIVSADEDFFLGSSSTVHGELGTMVLVDGSVATGKDSTISAGGTFVMLTVGEDVNIGEGGDVLAGTGAILGAIGGTLTAGTGAQFVAGSSIVVTAGEDVLMSDNVTMDAQAGFVQLTATNGQLSFGDNGTVTATTDIIFSANQSITIGDSGFFDADANIEMGAGTDLSIGTTSTMDAGFEIYLEAMGGTLTVGANASLTGGTTSAGGIGLVASDDITLGDNSYLYGFDLVDMDASGTVSVGNSSTVASGGDLLIDAVEDVLIGLDTLLSAEEGLGLVAVTGSVMTGQDSTLTAGFGAAAVPGNTSIILTAAEDVTIGTGNTLNAGVGNVLGAAGGTLTVGSGSTVVAGAAIGLSGDDGVEIGSSATVDAQGSVLILGSLNDDIMVGVDTTVTAATDLEFNAATTIDTGVGSTVGAGTAILFDAGGDITTNGTTDASASGIEVTLLAGGTITDGGNTFIFTDGTLRAEAGGDVDLTLSGTAGSTVTAAVSAGGDLDFLLKDGGDLIIDEVTSGGGTTTGFTAAAGYADIDLEDGTLTINGNVTAGAGSLSLMADDMVIGSAVSATGDIFIAPHTDGNGMGINDAGAGTLNLSQAEIDLLSTPGAVKFGRVGAGDIHLGADGSLDLTAVNWSSVEFATDNALYMANGIETQNLPLTLDSDVILTGNTVLDTINGGTGADVKVTGSIEGTSSGAQTLTVMTGDSDIEFQGKVGQATPLGTLDLSGFDIIVTDIQTVGTQTFTALGEVTFGSDYITNGFAFFLSGGLTLADDVLVDTSIPAGTGADITMDDVTNNGFTLTLDAGNNGAINLASWTNTPPYAGQGTLNIIDSDTTTITGTVSGHTMAVTDSTTNISLLGDVDLNTLTFGPGPYSVDIIGGSVFLIDFVDFNNSGAITLGDSPGDTFVFAGGIDATNGGVFVSGGFTFGGLGILATSLSLAGDTSFDTAGGNMQIGSIFGNGYGLMLDAGTGGNIYLGSVTNPLGTGWLNIVDADIVNVSGDTTAGTVDIDTAQTSVTFEGMLTATNLYVGAGDYMFSLLGGSLITSFVEFLNSGGVQIGDEGGDVNTFLDGAESTASDTTYVAGLIQSQGGEFTFGDLVLYANTTIDSTLNTDAGADINFLGTINNDDEEDEPEYEEQIIPHDANNILVSDISYTPWDMVVDAGNESTATFAGAVGDVSPIGSLNVSALDIILHDVTTVGTQIYSALAAGGSLGQVEINSTHQTMGADYDLTGNVSIGDHTKVDTTYGGAYTTGDIFFGGSGGAITFMQADGTLTLLSGGSTQVRADFAGLLSELNSVEIWAWDDIDLAGGTLGDDLVLHAGGFIEGDGESESNEGGDFTEVEDANEGGDITINDNMTIGDHTEMTATGNATFLAAEFNTYTLAIRLNGLASSTKLTRVNIGDGFDIGGLTFGMGSSDLFGSIRGNNEDVASAFGNQLEDPRRDNFLFNKCVVEVSCSNFDPTSVVIPIFEPIIYLYEKDGTLNELRYSDLPNTEIWYGLGGAPNIWEERLGLDPEGEDEEEQ